MGNIPILINHDPTNPIGRVEIIGGEFIAYFDKDARITLDMAYEIFGNAGIRLLEVTIIDSVLFIDSVQILEFSFPRTA